MTEDFANKVYDILIEFGGATESYRSSFIHAHCKDEYPCQEWRFQGHLGFGGKYRSERNKVDYYAEDQTDERDAIKNTVNTKLQAING